MAVFTRINAVSQLYVQLHLQKVLPLFTYKTIRSYRQITMEQDGNLTTITGEIVRENAPGLAKKPLPDDPCPLRSRGIKITPEDVLILNQFITSTGEIIGQEETGLSTREYFKVISCIKQAQRANMLPGEELQEDIHGNYVPKLNRYLTRYQIGSPLKVMRKGPWYRQIYYKIGDERIKYDAPRVSNKKPALHH